jgi:lipoprotein-anchoring transpeptidase ErfK/SrfK
MEIVSTGFRLLACGWAGLLLAACASTPDAPEAADPPMYDWHPEGLSGKTRVVINLPEQRADITIGGQSAGWTIVTTGKEGYDTPAGEYKVLEKIVDKRSNLYGITVDADGNVVNDNADARKDKVPSGGEFKFARMPYWMRLTHTGIGMHAGIIPRPGETASHGCIRLPEEFAPRLFDYVVVGTPVRIVR